MTLREQANTGSWKITFSGELALAEAMHLLQERHHDGVESEISCTMPMKPGQCSKRMEMTLGVLNVKYLE